MAHHMTVRVVPHRNKDGSESASKKDYEVWDRSRGRKVRIGVVSSKKAANDLISACRKMLHSNHMRLHPADAAFRQKHGFVKGAN